MSYRSPVEENPKKFGGQPVFRDTRVPVYLLDEYIKAGYTLEEFADMYDLNISLVRDVYNLNLDSDHEGDFVFA